MSLLLLFHGAGTPAPPSSALLFRTDTGTIDDDTEFQGYIFSRALVVGKDISKLGHYGEPVLQAKARVSTSLTVSYNREFGKEVRPHTVSIAPAAAEYRIVRKVEGLELADIGVLQVKVGDASAVDSAWVLERLDVPEDVDGDR
jgi:hypothetical protein